MPVPVHLDLAIYRADMQDIPEILRQRRAMYEDMGEKNAVKLAAMISVSEDYLNRAVADGSFRAWLASSEGHIVGGGAVVISPWPAHPYDLECRRATILNVYTYREFRRRGIARCVMNTMIEWCRQENFSRVSLHASEDGRSLYESLGFEGGNEMKLKLR